MILSQSIVNQNLSGMTLEMEKLVRTGTQGDKKDGYCRSWKFYQGDNLNKFILHRLLLMRWEINDEVSQKSMPGSSYHIITSMTKFTEEIYVVRQLYFISLHVAVIS